MKSDPKSVKEVIEEIYSVHWGFQFSRPSRTRGAGPKAQTRHWHLTQLKHVDSVQSGWQLHCLQRCSGPFCVTHSHATASSPETKGTCCLSITVTCQLSRLKCSFGVQLLCLCVITMVIWFLYVQSWKNIRRPNQTCSHQTQRLPNQVPTPAWIMWHGEDNAIAAIDVRNDVNLLIIKKNMGNR